MACQSYKDNATNFAGYWTLLAFPRERREEKEVRE